MKQQETLLEKKWQNVHYVATAGHLKTTVHKHVTELKKLMHNKEYTFCEKALGRCYKGYIEWVARTSTIELVGDADVKRLGNAVIGFGHGDSFGVQFLLKELGNGKNKVQVIITADKRGNYIEYIGKAYGASPLRMPDGARLRGFLQELKEAAALPNTALCIALDGPLGPWHEPKKLGFMLANEGEKEMVLVGVDYTRKLHLFKRWDNYVVPLPYGKMTFQFHHMGKVGKEDLRQFKDYKEKIKHQLGW